MPQRCAQAVHRQVGDHLGGGEEGRIVLAALTVPPARRLTELSGHPATTVHQLRPGGDAPSCRDLPLNADLVVGAGEVRRSAALALHTSAYGMSGAVRV